MKTRVSLKCFVNGFRHPNIMTAKGIDILDECAERSVHQSPQEEECTSSFRWKLNEINESDTIAKKKRI